MKTKQLEKGVQQLTEEGVAQLFTITTTQYQNYWYSRRITIRCNSIQIIT
jgi:hypothetical protein